MDENQLKPLMLASLHGEAAAHRELLSRLSGDLRAYYRGRLARIGRSATEAEDLVQEALMAIHMRRDTYDPAELLTPWVRAIARYKLIDHLRHTRGSMLVVPIDDIDPAAEDNAAAGIESSLDLGKLMSGLPDRMRTAVQAVKLDGLSVAEAAARLNISESSVKVSVHRGLKALAAMIGRENAS
ncbi:RNA polymerase subunit sigma [Rhodopseudomonas sp. AAP120]|uniref:sigma-70 family RNA polymerase sigma factor n=1 Tax=Rhodopseudomonas TaxID=1073 RepID=UPI000164BE37|nr:MULTISPECIES: sigma-70 family RNA polymerase sigma factor [Rhodopseudomonas]ACE99618.1 RNA polymerase, sigma-24 subunit, ECF subfamily [Rhodopseudomonas palustris TIE-1]KPF96175.1 RNA polymerase subunit sigma [Rhodopseudomonas sp. AAP120]